MWGARSQGLVDPSTFPFYSQSLWNTHYTSLDWLYLFLQHVTGDYNATYS